MNCPLQEVNHSRLIEQYVGRMRDRDAIAQIKFPKRRQLTLDDDMLPGAPPL